MAGLRQEDPIPKRNAATRKRRIPPLPPASLRSFEGARILDEVAGELGYFLFQRLRDISLATATDPRLRAQLFSPNRERAPCCSDLVDGEPLQPSLEVLLGVVQHPDALVPGIVAGACARVSQWAGDRALYHTAYEYAALAAETCLTDPLLCVAAGRIARKQARYEHARQWFRRAAGLARAGREWSAGGVTFISWAALELQLGRLDNAQALLMRAWRLARRHDLRHLAARARHDLLQIAIDREDWTEAEEHASAAFDLYKKNAPNLVALAHDWAYVWLCQCYFSVALPVFEAVRPHLKVPNERILVLASIARCAGALGDHARFEDAAEAMLQIANLTSENTAAALVNGAEGALSLRRVEQARSLAERSLQLARGRSESLVATAAADLLARINRQGRADRNEEPAPERGLSETAARLIARVRAIAS